MGELIKFPGRLRPINSNPHALPPAVANLTPEEEELLREHGDSKGGEGRKNPRGLLPETVADLSEEQRRLLEEQQRRLKP